MAVAGASSAMTTVAVPREVGAVTRAGVDLVAVAAAAVVASVEVRAVWTDFKCIRYISWHYYFGVGDLPKKIISHSFSSTICLTT